MFALKGSRFSSSPTTPLFMGSAASTKAVVNAEPAKPDAAAPMEEEVIDAPDCKAPPPAQIGSIAGKDNNNAGKADTANEGAPAAGAIAKDNDDNNTTKANDRAAKIAALKAQGNQFFADGDDANAAEAYTKAIALDPHSHVLFSNRSGAYLRAGRCDTRQRVQRDAQPVRVAGGQIELQQRQGVAAKQSFRVAVNM